MLGGLRVLSLSLKYQLAVGLQRSQLTTRQSASVGLGDQEHKRATHTRITAEHAAPDTCGVEASWCPLHPLLTQPHGVRQQSATALDQHLPGPGFDPNTRKEKRMQSLDNMQPLFLSIFSYFINLQELTMRSETLCELRSFPLN